MIDTLVRSRAIEVCGVLLEDASQVGLAHDDDVVEALTTDAAQHSLADRIRTRCLDRRAQHLDSAAHRDGIEVRTIFRIVVANQVLRRDAKERL